MASQMRYIKELIRPPKSPLGLDRQWETVEDDLGTSLPKDYKEFVELYGTGVVCRALTVWNFLDTKVFKSTLLETLCGKTGILESYQRSRMKNQSEWPPMYPDSGGLIPFATMGDVDNLCWRTIGRPNDWDVMYWEFDDDSLIGCAGDNFTTFLLKWLRDQQSDARIYRCDKEYRFDRGVELLAD